MNPLTDALCARSLEGATGALDWTDQKRRRVFFFEHGRIVLIQSNLRSEQAAPPAGPDEVAAAAHARITGALREAGGEARWMEGAAAPRHEPADLATAVWESGPRRPALGSWLKTVAAGAGWLHRQAMPAELAHYLEELDGTRTLDEVVAFAPAEPELVERWVRVAFTVGALLDVGIEANPYEVRSVARRRDWDTGASVDDIASLISAGLGQSAPPPATPTRPDAITERFGPALRRIRQAPDHFAVLGVSWQDAPESLRRAYFALARDLHPDGFAGAAPEVQEVAVELFDKVRAAWEVLGDDTKRAAYIRKVIHGEKTEDELAMEKVRAILEAEGDFKRALVEFNAGRIAAAHELFVRAADSVPEEHEFAAHAGYTTFRVYAGKDPERADAGVARLKAALEANERLDTAWVLLAKVYRDRKDRTAARECLVKALKIRPTNPDAPVELKRLERDRPDEDAKGSASGLFNKLFGKK